MNFEELLEKVKSWVREVGEYQLRSFRSGDLGITVKSSEADVVTRIDKESEAMLVSFIRTAFPGHFILGEEGGCYEKERNAEESYTWIIDPLDGTNNYSQGLPVFAVSVGLQKDGETLLGVVYAPYLNEMYYAVKGKGAYLNGRPLRIKHKPDLGSSVIATGFPYDKGTHPQNNLANLQRILPYLRGIRRMGSAAYDLCCVAAGFLDGYWELNLNIWDVCAGILIVEEAGGRVMPFRKDRNISIVAGSFDSIERILPFLDKD